MVNKHKIPHILDSLLKNTEESHYAKMMYAAIILIVILIIRLFFMQIVEGSYYKAEADGNRIRSLPVQAARGVIYDRKGLILAGSRSAYSVTIPVDRKVSSLPPDELNRLSNLLNIPVDELNKRIENHKSSFDTIYLANDVGLDVATQIEEKKDDFPNIEIEVNPLRVYPYNEAGAQVLGYVSEAGPDDRDADGNPYKSSTIIGRSGIERQYNKYLEGKNGSKNVEVNAAGQPVKTISGTPVQVGQNIRLTLDAKLQKAAQDAIVDQMHTLNASGVFPTGASAIAVDPNTGAVLAMVSWPSFNPNDFSKGITTKKWNEIINDPNHPMQNRPISSAFPPGSVYKVITASAALESKVTTPDEQIFDSGRHWLVDKRNASGEAFGWINMYGAIEKSDNVYFYEMGRRVGIKRLSEMARDFGLGSKTGIDLEGEVAGNVASEEYKRKLYNQDWYLGETMDAAIGQSFTLTTPIQMMMIYSAIANGGMRYQPYILSRVDNHDGTPELIVTSKKIGTLPISKTTLDVLRRGLREVMTGGTGSFLFNGYPVPLAGKSGTAETNGLDNGWFIAYGPFDKPDIVVACIFEHAGFGSESAAPVVKEILDAHFGVGEYAPGGSKAKNDRKTNS